MAAVTSGTESIECVLVSAERRETTDLGWSSEESAEMGRFCCGPKVDKGSRAVHERGSCCMGSGLSFAGHELRL